MYAYSEGSESGKKLISRVERNTVSDEEWEEFEVEAERPEPISEDEWSSAETSIDERLEDDENIEVDRSWKAHLRMIWGRIWRMKARRTHFCLRLSRGLLIAFEEDS
jgi:hypothetical protein